MLDVIMLNFVMLNVVMLSVVMLNVVMLSAFLLNVVMLSVVAPPAEIIIADCKIGVFLLNF
jgi:hypothetical protein